MKYGLHISTAGDLPGTPARAKAMGADALQFFAGSPRTFKMPIYTDEVAAAFRDAAIAENMPTFIHMMYLTAYGTPDAGLRRRSIDAAKQTMVNAEALGVRGVVTHLGSHKGAGTASVIDDLRDGLLETIEQTENSMLLLENSAGAGSNIGNSIDELALIYEALDHHPKVGFCLDTAHLFGSGYDIRTEDDWKAVLDEFDTKIGLDKIGVFHLNDSKVELDSKRDRHENIGHGFIGEDGFRAILNDPRTSDYYGLLEVPGLAGKGPDKPNLDMLRELTK
jgi:deoxyribonuclease-4